MRKIDGKFHTDGNHIIKTPNGEILPTEEPLFLFRARDHNAIAGLKAYREICVRDGCNDYQLSGVDEAIKSFSEFAAEYPERMKQPGITRGK